MSGIPGLGFHDRWDAIEQDAECTSVLVDIVDVKVVASRPITTAVEWPSAHRLARSFPSSGNVSVLAVSKGPWREGGHALPWSSEWDRTWQQRNDGLHQMYLSEEAGEKYNTGIEWKREPRWTQPWKPKP